MYTDRKRRLCSSMEASLDDKLFWMEHVPEEVILVDYGCADASMMIAARLRCESREGRPNGADHSRQAMPALGIECCEDMLELARANIRQSSIYTGASAINMLEVGTDWRGKSQAARALRDVLNRPIVLVANSVLHEIKSAQGNLRQFASLVDYLQPDYIAVRDMEAVPGWGVEAMTMGEKVEDLCAARLSATGENPIWSESWNLMGEYKRTHGKPITVRDAYHMMMHFRYDSEEDIRAEMEEDYFVLHKRDVKKAVGKEYTCQSRDTFGIPALVSKLFSTFDVELPMIDTHAKYIFKRN